MMQYTYVAAWAVHSDVVMPENSEAIELFKSDSCRFVLTRDPDDLLACADRGSAIGSVLLRMFVGQADSDFASALSAAITQIAAERRRKASGLPVLVFEGHGDVDATVAEDQSPQPEGFTVVIDAFDKREITAAHRPAIEAMKLVLAFESESRSRFTALSEVIYLNAEDGKPVYSLRFSGSAEAGVARNLGPETLCRIAQRCASLQKRSDLENVQRLFTHMADVGNDRLRTFLFGWAALESLVERASSDQRIVRERLLQRRRDAKTGRPGLRDKFLALSSLLFSDLPDATSADDEVFCRLKNLRNDIYHGRRFSEQDLPVHELSALLRKYVLAYMETA